MTAGKHTLSRISEDDDCRESKSCLGPHRKYRRFSVGLSTENHFRIGVDDTPLYVGAFGNIRKQYLDHDSFHCHYRKERQWLHDSIIEDYLENVEPVVPGCETRWLVLTVGVQGAGKNYTMMNLADEEKFLLTSYCCVDIDEVRRLLPEFRSFVDNAPELVDSCTGKEAGYIAETLCWASFQAGHSVLWDTSLRHPQWFCQLAQRLKQAFSHLKVAVIHIDAPSAEVVQDRRERMELITGRRLYPDDLEFFESEMERMKKSVEIVRSEADFFATISNTPNGLEILDQKWEGFTQTFEQSNRKVPKMSRFESSLDEDSLAMPPPPRPSMSRRSMLLQRTSSRRCSGRCFSVLQSTEENHCSNDMQFYGRFAHIRATLDYSYHRNYTFERQRFQDSVLQDFMQKVSITDKDGFVCTTPTEPWIVFTAGAMGAGKSWTMKRMVDRGLFPLVAFVNVDPDELRRMLPEYHLYANLAPELAGELTRKEAGFLAEILTLAGLQAGKNVLVDGSLRDSKWYQEYFGRLRKEFPILRLAIIQVTAPKETILARARARAEETGRVVPEPLLLQAYEQVPRSVKVLQPLVDYHVTLHNPSDGDVSIGTEGESWQSFQSQWIQ